MDYTVNMTDGSVTTITAVEEVKQVYGFVQFKDTDDELIIAVRADTISSYEPKSEPKPKPVIAKMTSVRRIIKRRK